MSLGELVRLGGRGWVSLEELVRLGGRGWVSFGELVRLGVRGWVSTLPHSLPHCLFPPTVCPPARHRCPLS